MSVPAITVLMPVRDGTAYLRAAIDSVLGQTFSEFGLVIVDDGSTDATPEILRDYAARDARITVVRQDRDGLVNALNRGIAAARAPLIARLDADDIAMPQRLGRQVEAMHARSDLGLLGSHAETIDDAGRLTGRLTPVTDHDDLVNVLRKSNPMIHSTVVFRRQLALDLGGFRQAFEGAEDYDLWLRMSERSRIANLPECLIRYRTHQRAVSVQIGTRSAFSVRLAKRSAAMRRSGLADLANGLTAPPDWRHPPADAFYVQDARDFSLLEFANADVARSLSLDHVEPGVVQGLAARLDHRERKIAQCALFNILDRADRPAGFDSMKLWSTFLSLHPLRAAKMLLQAGRLPRPRLPRSGESPSQT
jgi:glycosyltransferase involved in cell wall biosynthesis